MGSLSFSAANLLKPISASTLEIFQELETRGHRSRGGFMGRLFASTVCSVALLALVASLPGCGTPNATRVVNFPTPANIILNPATTSSMDVGSTQTFTATPQNRNKLTIATPVSFRS